MGVSTEWSARKQYAMMALTARVVMSSSLTLNQKQPPQNSAHHIFLAHFSHHSTQGLTSCLVISWNCPFTRCASSAIWPASQPSGGGTVTRTKQVPPPYLVSSPHVVTVKFCISEIVLHNWSQKKLSFFSVLYSALFSRPVPFWQQDNNYFSDYFSLFNLNVFIGILGNMGSQWA